jgi:hypothetical protein
MTGTSKIRFTEPQIALVMRANPNCNLNRLAELSFEFDQSEKIIGCIGMLCLAVLSNTANAGEFYGGPPAYSVVKIVRAMKGCWPITSTNCVTFNVGDEVTVGVGRMVNDYAGQRPRYGHYCLRPINQTASNPPCWFTDITAIEEKPNGKPVPIVRTNEPEKKRVDAWADTLQDRSKLEDVYSLWAYVSVCNKARRGYLAQYINDTELEQARIVVKALEKEILARSPGLAGEDKEYAWKTATNTRVIVSDSHCRFRLSALLRSHKSGAIVIPAP